LQRASAGFAGVAKRAVTFGVEPPLSDMRVLPATWTALSTAGQSTSACLPTERLVVRAVGRDREAERTLYDRHVRQIHRFVCDLVGDRADASDVVQETFVRAFRLLPTLSEPSRFGPWLYAIARNVCLECLKARYRWHKLRGDSAQVRAPNEGVLTPERELIDREVVDLLERALTRLSTDRRTVLLLRVDHGLAYEEIAAVMGWTLAKAKVEVHRARAELRRVLERGGRRQ
jgi:RNA polymerase sigma-70 factor (ECF subfamily)